MTIRKQVQCVIKKGDGYEPHERISQIGGYSGNVVQWTVPESTAINQIEQGIFEYFVDADDKEVKVVVAKHKTRKYLKTEADGYEPNNLLNLPMCKY